MILSCNVVWSVLHTQIWASRSTKATSVSLWVITPPPMSNPEEHSIKVIWRVLQRANKGQLLAKVLWCGWLLLCDGFTQQGWVTVNNSGSVVMALGKQCQNRATVKCQHISHITDFISRFMSLYMEVVMRVQEFSKFGFKLQSFLF